MGRRTLALIITGIAAVGAACSSSDSSESTSPSTTAPTTTTVVEPTTTTLPTEPIRVDWSEPGEVPLPNGWTLRECDAGTRTNVCVYDGTKRLGDVELLPSYPLGPDDDASDPEATALAWANRMIEHHGRDRAEGCAPFTFRPLPVSAATVGGRRGARGGFTLTNADGVVVEHVVNHYVLVDGAMTIINADAYAEQGGCLPPSEEDPSFAPDQLADFEPILARLVADSPATAS